MLIDICCLNALKIQGRERVPVSLGHLDIPQLIDRDFGPKNEQSRRDLIPAPTSPIKPFSAEASFPQLALGAIYDTKLPCRGFGLA
jgi:hypothetical protein